MTPVNGGTLIDMKFNDPNTATTTVTSSVGGYEFATRSTGSGGSTGPAAPYQTAAGVSGSPGDYALDFTSATRMGSGTGNAGPVAQYLANTGSAIGAQTSLTLSGWFRTDGAQSIGNRATLFEIASLSLNASTTTGALTLSVRDSSNTLIALDSTAGYTAQGQWVFFAATFDGTILSGNNVSFYIGGVGTAVSLVSSGRIDLADWIGFSGEATGSAIRLGNNGSTQVRPFDGYLDNMALYGEASGGGGALTQSQLEAMRLAAVPEPTVAGLLLLGGVTVAMIRRRR